MGLFNDELDIISDEADNTLNESINSDSSNSTIIINSWDEITVQIDESGRNQNKQSRIFLDNMITTSQSVHFSTNNGHLISYPFDKISLSTIPNSTPQERIVNARKSELFIITSILSKMGHLPKGWVFFELSRPLSPPKI